jgi:IS5 family transposase
VVKDKAHFIPPAIDPVIGHCKTDNGLDRNYLKGVQGDKINAILSACGFDIHKLLRKIIFLLYKFTKVYLLE